MHFVFNILYEKTLSVINAIEKRHKQTPPPRPTPHRNVKLTFLVASWVWMRPLRGGNTGFLLDTNPVF